MAETVNLDALIPRADFLTPVSADTPAGSAGKPAASLTDLSEGESFFTTLRKPDFQRETAAWTPMMVRDFVKSFIDDELIPAVICWQSDARLSFVIDGAHRLSAIIAWALNDYGDGEVSRRFYGNEIPDEQIRIAKKTRDLIEESVGSALAAALSVVPSFDAAALRQRLRDREEFAPGVHRREFTAHDGTPSSVRLKHSWS